MKKTAILLITLALVLAGCQSGKDSTKKSGSKGWVLKQVENSSVKITTGPSLRMTGEMIIGSGGCNQYTATYKISGETISIQISGVTEKACDNEVMKQEDEFLKMLGTVAKISKKTDQLTLTTDAGAKLVFKPKK